MIENGDENNPYHDIKPRSGSFEVSINGVLLFSKCLSKAWPHYAALAKRCAEVTKAIEAGQELKAF